MDRVPATASRRWFGLDWIGEWGQMSLWSHSKALLSLAVVSLNLAFWCLPVMLLGAVKWMIPSLRAPADSALEWVYRAALWIDDRWLKNVMGLRWKAPSLGLSSGENVIVVSNHASWADILIIQSIVVRQGPVLKFLAKRELTFIPIFGVILWAFDFPILRRGAGERELESERRRRDLGAIEEACRILETRPAALLCFAEGTRFDEAKRRDRSSPFTHLLAPKVGGLSALLDALSGNGLRILDLTIEYPRPPSFWAFLAGETEAIGIDAELIDARDVPRERDARRAWLFERWAIKDEQIEAFRRATP